MPCIDAAVKGVTRSSQPDTRGTPHLAQALAFVINVLPAATARSAIRRLLEPMVAALKKGGVDGGDAKLATHELDRMTVVVGHVRPRLEVRTLRVAKSKGAKHIVR